MSIGNINLRDIPQQLKTHKDTFIKKALNFTLKRIAVVALLAIASGAMSVALVGFMPMTAKVFSVLGAGFAFIMLGRIMNIVDIFLLTHTLIQK